MVSHIWDSDEGFSGTHCTNCSLAMPNNIDNISRSIANDGKQETEMLLGEVAIFMMLGATYSCFCYPA